MDQSDSPFLLAVDIGGTFTDFVLLHQPSSKIAIGKLLTSYPDPSEAVMDGLLELMRREAIAPQALGRVIHGTTLVTNAIIERQGAKTALLTTKGFRDALEIGNEGRYDIYDFGLVKPEPLVERRLRLELDERMSADGRVRIKLDEESLATAIRQLQHEEIESVAVCLLHAFTNPAHELRAGEMLGQRLPGIPVSLSHQVAPALREYPRTSTTVANAYVRPLTRSYLGRLDAGLKGAGIEAPFNIMLSNGGTCTVETASAYPIRLAESGPSGGALAGAYWGGRMGRADLLAFDMGGTTAKAIFATEGQFSITTESEIAHVHRFKKGSGLPLLTPSLEMIEIGAGGGSIARLNELGLPAVGPRSTGSSPGPACYGRGGRLPTVTDADLLLGYLNPDYFAGGSIRLDNEAAHEAFQPIAETVGMDVPRVAWGMHRVVNENMAAAARVHAAERGLDIRSYAMVATGGAGPVHAAGVAEQLGMKTVIIPPIAGVASAFGLLLAPLSFDFTRSYLTQLDQIDFTRLNQILDELETEGRSIVEEAGVAPDQITVKRSVDMRYVRQGYEIRVPFANGVIEDVLIAQIQSNFEAEYVRFYGRLCDGVPIQAVHWRVVVAGPSLELEEVRLEVAQGDVANRPVGRRKTLFDADVGPATSPVYRRNQLQPGFTILGPAVVEEAESTTIVPPGWRLSAQESGCLILERGALG